LWAMLHAFGAPPPFAVVVLAYFVGQVGNTIPIPGAVSGGIVGVLVAFAVPADLALVSVLAYRAIAIWLPAPIGLVALGALRRTMGRWSAEDAEAEVQVEVAQDVAPGQPVPAPVPVARAPRPCPEPALLAA
ncbi:MAG TPA: YbhN family protein, partial [Solirubrobacteraceae bacterium]